MFLWPLVFLVDITYITSVVIIIISKLHNNFLLDITTRSSFPSSGIPFSPLFSLFIVGKHTLYLPQQQGENFMSFEC